MNRTIPSSTTPAAPTPANSPAVPEPTSNRYLLRWMFAFLRPVKAQVFFACLYLAAFCGLEVLTVRQSGRAVDDIRQLHPLSAGALGFRMWLTAADPQTVRLRHTIVAFVIMTLALLVLRYLTTVSRSKMSMSMVYYLREAIYDKLQRVGFGFHDAATSGQLINRALSDLQNVRAFIETAVLVTLEIVLIVGGYIILIMTLSPWLALLALAPLPLWTWYVLRFSRIIQPAAKAVMEAEDKNVSLITENIAGVHVVKAFATERQEIDRYNTNCESFLGRVRTRIRLFADFQPVIRSIATASYLTLFCAAGICIIRGSLQIGSLLVLGGAMSAILNRLQQVSNINEQYQNAMVSSRRLYEVLMAGATVPEKEEGLPLPTTVAASEMQAGKPASQRLGTVRFEHVSFGYNAAKPVLHDVSFSVPGGSIVAVVGPTGAGKTTLVNLIARFYDPQQGRILIDGVDIRHASLASLRTQVSFVFQETYLFSETVAGNIAYGRPGISPGEIESAARLAQAHEFIETLKDGYQTMLGERGSSLSGGQRQRLAIARAILTNPRVLILDDATASVDPETEDLIRRAMRFVMEGRTTFVIAHRISTVKRADVVIVIENGRIAQIGTHRELMARDGHYREIAAVQLYGDETDKGGPNSPSHMDRVNNDRNVAAVGVGGREAQSDV